MESTSQRTYLARRKRSSNPQTEEEKKSERRSHHAEDLQLKLFIKHLFARKKSPPIIPPINKIKGDIAATELSTSSSPTPIERIAPTLGVVSKSTASSAAGKDAMKYCFGEQSSTVTAEESMWWMAQKRNEKSGLLKVKITKGDRSGLFQMMRGSRSRHSREVDITRKGMLLIYKNKELSKVPQYGFDLSTCDINTSVSSGKRHDSLGSTGSIGVSGSPQLTTYQIVVSSRLSSGVESSDSESDETAHPSSVHLVFDNMMDFNDWYSLLDLYANHECRNPFIDAWMRPSLKLNAQGLIELCNEEFEKVFEYSLEDIAGRHITKIIALGSIDLHSYGIPSSVTVKKRQSKGEKQNLYQSRIFIGKPGAFKEKSEGVLIVSFELLDQFKRKKSNSFDEADILKMSSGKTSSSSDSSGNNSNLNTNTIINTTNTSSTISANSIFSSGTLSSFNINDNHLILDFERANEEDFDIMNQRLLLKIKWLKQRIKQVEAEKESRSKQSTGEETEGKTLTENTDESKQSSLVSSTSLKDDEKSDGQIASRTGSHQSQQSQSLSGNSSATVQSVSSVMMEKASKRKSRSQEHNEIPENLSASPSIDQDSAMIGLDKQNPITPLLDRGTVLDVTKIEQIGYGESASLFECVVNGWTCAMKELDTERCSAQTAQRIKNELNIYRSIPNHRNICRCLGYSWERKVLHVYLTKYSANLRWKIEGAAKGETELNTDECMRVAIDIIRGLMVIHSHGIVHRNLRSDNVLVMMNESDVVTSAAITDFEYGFDVNINARGESAEEKAPLPLSFAPPEMMLCHERREAELLKKRDSKSLEETPGQSNGITYSFEVDIWSFGVILYELIELKKPYEGFDKNAIKAAILEGSVPPFSPYLRQETLRPLKDICLLCLNRDPSLRPSLAQIRRNLLWAMPL